MNDADLRPVESKGQVQIREPNRASIYTSAASRPQSWVRETHFRRGSPVAMAHSVFVFFDMLQTPVFSQLDWDPSIHFTQVTKQPSDGNNLGWMGTSDLKLNACVSYYKSPEPSNVHLQGSQITLSLYYNQWRGLESNSSIMWGKIAEVVKQRGNLFKVMPNQKRS